MGCAARGSRQVGAPTASRATPRQSPSTATAELRRSDEVGPRRGCTSASHSHWPLSPLDGPRRPVELPRPPPPSPLVTSGPRWAEAPAAQPRVSNGATHKSSGGAGQVVGIRHVQCGWCRLDHPRLPTYVSRNDAGHPAPHQRIYCSGGGRGGAGRGGPSLTPNRPPAAVSVKLASVRPRRRRARGGGTGGVWWPWPRAERRTRKPAPSLPGVNFPLFRACPEVV